jgi:hypothetical protein
MLHACDHPPPHHILLVSGDEDFTYGLHRLALRCYHVHVALNLDKSLVAQPALQRLTASGRAWQWQALLRGDVAAMPYTETLGVPTFAGVPPLRQVGKTTIEAGTRTWRPDAGREAWTKLQERCVSENPAVTRVAYSPCMRACKDSR